MRQAGNQTSANGVTEFAITMGMVLVAFLAAVAGTVPLTTITSTLRRTS
jgi:hypothetical protein